MYMISQSSFWASKIHIIDLIKAYFLAPILLIAMFLLGSCKNSRIASVARILVASGLYILYLYICACVDTRYSKIFHNEPFAPILQ